MYRVMLADDEPIMRKALLNFISWEELNCEVIYTAANGQEVMNHLEEMLPDILITDIRMPGHDGVDIAGYIWEKKLPVKVIILTAYADFSYAQAAIRYGVIEYVTKTGVFDGLSAAVEKCIEGIESEKKPGEHGEEKEAEENFFRAVIDGSLFDEQEIRAKAERLHLQTEDYQVMLLHFRMHEETDAQTRKKIHKSLKNFFHMVFGSQMLQGLFVKRDLFCVVLRKEKDSTGRQLEESCHEIIDMMDHFMKLGVYIGISEKSSELTELKEYYEQADTALKSAMAERKTKISFYQQGVVLRKDALLEECLQLIEERFKENLTVSDIARELGTSISYLSRIFKEATGNTLIYTIHQKKVEKAKEYLEQTDMKIYEIAAALGFENATYFSHFFKKHTGYSPKVYR